MSCAVRKPRCRSPVTSITSVVAKRPIASATNPSYQARRAASSCTSRSSLGRLGLAEDPRVGGGQHRVGEPAAGRGDSPAGQVDLGRGSPVLAEHVGHAGDAPADRGHERVPGLGVADRVAEHVAQRQPPVLAQQQEPGAERARHARGEQPAARHEVEPEVPVGLQGRRRRGGALAADDERLAAPRVVADHRHLAARAVQVRLDDLEHEAGRDRGVEGVAAFLQDGHAGRRGEPVRGRHHAERPRELRPGRELRNVRHTLLRPCQGFRTHQTSSDRAGYAGSDTTRCHSITTRVGIM